MHNKPNLLKVDIDEEAACEAAYLAAEKIASTPARSLDQVQTQAKLLVELTGSDRHQDDLIQRLTSSLADALDRAVKRLGPLGWVTATFVVWDLYCTGGCF